MKNWVLISVFDTNRMLELAAFISQAELGLEDTIDFPSKLATSLVCYGFSRNKAF